MKAFIRRTFLLSACLFFISCSNQYDPVPGVARYNEEPSYFRGNKAEKRIRALMEEVCEAAGASEYLSRDPALDAAARNLSVFLKREGGDRINNIGGGTIRDFLQEMGVTESAYQTLFFQVAWIDNAKSSIRDTFQKNLKNRRFTHFGVGVVRIWWPPSYIASIILTRKAIALESFPRSVLPIVEQNIQGRILLPGDALRLFVQSRNKTETYAPGVTTGGFFSLDFSFLDFGEHTLELMLDGPSGPEVAALFNVRVEGREVESEARVLERMKIKTVEQARDRLFALINDERRRFGLIPVSRDSKVTRIAQSYAAEMRRTGQVTHISEESGDCADRAKAAGINYRRITENVAVNQSIEDVHEGFMNSPAHRINVVDDQVDWVGIGVAFSKDRSHLYVVENFVKYQ